MGRPRKATPPEAVDAGKNVLIIEADPEQQVTLAHALRRQGHRVVAASSAAGAIALTTHFPMDLVLVSQELPRTTGVDVTHALLAHRPEVRVVIVASEGSPGLTAVARRVGALDCVTRDLVVQGLEHWLAEAEPPSSAAGSFDVPVAAQSAE